VSSLIVLRCFGATMVSHMISRVYFLMSYSAFLLIVLYITASFIRYLMGNVFHNFSLFLKDSVGDNILHVTCLWVVLAMLFLTQCWIIMFCSGCKCRLVLVVSQINVSIETRPTNQTRH